MPWLRTLPAPVKEPAEAGFLFEPGEERTLADVIRLAREYPFPHSVLGKAECAAYVHKLASRVERPGEGWYGAGSGDRLRAAAYLSVYGLGTGRGHTLWKIRHPLLDGSGGRAFLTPLLLHLTRRALIRRPGSAKFVLFLGQHETDAMTCAREAGFELEGRFADYYRLGEECRVFGRTVR